MNHQSLCRYSALSALIICGSFITTAAVAQDEAQVPTGNSAVALRLINEVWNAASLEVLDEIMAPDFVSHGPTHDETKNLDDFRTFVAAMRAAFPDLVITAEQVIADGDRMAVAWRVTGTNTGTLDEIPATGQSASLLGVTLYRFADGRIAESWYAWNELDLLTQLGLIPSP